MKVTLGLDIGSSSIKGVLCSRGDDGFRVHHAVYDNTDCRIATSNPSHYEESPQIVWEVSCNIIRRLSALARESRLVITDIGITGQMHGILLVDDAMEPMTHFISWQDKRGDERIASSPTHVERLRALAGEDPTGVGIHTGFGIATRAWLHMSNIVKSPSRVIGIYDWVASKLAGTLTTDITSAAAWGMLDIVSKQWKYNLTSTIGVDERTLPHIMEPGDIIGVISIVLATQLGLPPTTRIHATIGDTQASYLGSGCTESELLLNFGTGSQSMWETNTPVATHGTDIRYLTRGRYLAVAPTLAGGKAYHLLAEFYTSVVEGMTGSRPHREAIYAWMNASAANASSSGIVFDPIFAGSRFREESERASISNLSTINFTPGSVTRALLEGMIEEIAQPYFIREGAVTHLGLVGAGNGMRRNEALRNAARERFGLPLRVTPYTEEAAIGAAMLAGGGSNA